MEDMFPQLLDVFTNWLKPQWAEIGGARAAVAGKEVILAARSKKVQFDWDFADSLAEIESHILNDARFSDMQVETVCLIIFDHYVATHLENPTVYDYDGEKWSQIKWPCIIQKDTGAKHEPRELDC